MTPSKQPLIKPVIRAALYARISTLNHGQDPEVQLRELRDYANAEDSPSRVSTSIGDLSMCKNKLKL